MVKSRLKQQKRFMILSQKKDKTMTDVIVDANAFLVKADLKELAEKFLSKGRG